MKNYVLFCKYLGFDIAVHKRHKSIVNRNERTPSMFFYYNNIYDDYFFKDFSSGEHGGIVKFIMLNENISYEQAVEKVKALAAETHTETTYNKQIIKQNTFDYYIEKHQSCDLEYWEQYEIDKYFLIKHNTYPISDVYINNKFIARRAIGYFDDNGNLLQIYMPANSIYNDSDKKIFYTVKKTFFFHSNNSKVLILTKSKKDIIVLDMLFGEKVDLMAPMSETTKIEKDTMFWICINKYKKKFINFDNDNTGLQNMKKYEKLGFEPLICLGAKDVSDCVKNKISKEDMFNLKVELI